MVTAAHERMNERRATIIGDCSPAWKLRPNGADPPATRQPRLSTCSVSSTGSGPMTTRKSTSSHRSGGPSSLTSSPGPSRRTSFLSQSGGGAACGELACVSPAVGRSIQSLTSALGKSRTMRERTKSTTSMSGCELSLGDSGLGGAGMTHQKRYHDISRGTTMANMKLMCRGHRQLRPLRKGVIGLSETDLLALGERLRLAFYECGVIKNRRWRLISHPATFLAIDAVEWLVAKGNADTQQQAVTIMTCLQRNSIIVNLTDERDFSPVHAFFRFRCDDVQKPSVPVIDLVDCHTSNLLRSWASRDKHIISHNQRGNKSYRFTFVPFNFIAHLAKLKECMLSEQVLISLCQILQESRCIVQVYPSKPAIFTNVQSQLFRFRQDAVILSRAKEVVQRRVKKTSKFVPRWMSATESLSAAVLSPINRAKTILMRGRREIIPDRGQVYRPEMWDGLTLQLVSSLKDEWGFTLHGTTPVRVSSVDKEGPARKLLKVGDIVLQIDGLDVFRMNGQQVMAVIREGKAFCQVTIHQRPAPPVARPMRSIRTKVPELNGPESMTSPMLSTTS